MNISCTQENLNQGLFIVSHVATKSTTLPILQNIVIRAEKNSIQLAATNLEIGITCTVRGKVEKEGVTTVAAKLLSEYVALLPSGQQVDIAIADTSEDELVQVVCGRQRTNIKGMPATDFPVIPAIEKGQGYQLSAQSLRQAINQVLFAVSTSETRPEINGVLFSFTKGHLLIAATDSYRLAEKKIMYQGKVDGGEIDVIVPARSLQEVQRILGGSKDPAGITEDTDVVIHVTDNQISFTLGSVEISSRLIEGKYPEYQQIIPTQLPNTVQVERSALSTAMKTASLFSQSGSFDVAITLDVEHQELVVSSINSQLGESTSRVPAEITGASEKLILNYRYVLDGLQNIPTSTVEFKIIDANSPCILVPTGTGADYLYLIMPIRQ
jgi:DNA polymerase-3 subunit beta